MTMLVLVGVLMLVDTDWIGGSVLVCLCTYVYVKSIHLSVTTCCDVMCFVWLVCCGLLWVSLSGALEDSIILTPLY